MILTLHDVGNYLTKNSEVMTRKGSITVQQWMVLLQIAGEPSFPQKSLSLGNEKVGVLASEIAAARGVSRANISSVVTTLLRRGLVRQIDDLEDRRRKLLTITRKGENCVEKIEPVRNILNDALFADFSEDELTAALHFLRRCLEKLWHLGDEIDSCKG